MVTSEFVSCEMMLQSCALALALSLALALALAPVPAPAAAAERLLKIPLLPW